MAAKEFEVLALDGHNFPQWAMDIKVSLSTRGLCQCLAPPTAGDPPIPEALKYGALYMIRNHVHPDLKSEYMLELDLLKPWDSLKQRYEQQKTIVFCEASMSGTNCVSRISNPWMHTIMLFIR
jgi:hypothetical protein